MAPRVNGAGPSLRRYLVEVSGVVEVKFDAVTKPRFGTSESAGDLRQAGDAQDQGLMRHPGAGVRQRAMAAGGHQSGAVGGELLAGFVDERIEGLVRARSPRLSEQRGGEGIAAEDADIVDVDLFQRRV